MTDFLSKILDPLPVFKEYIYDTLTHDADMNPDFDPADPAMSSSWESLSSNPEAFNQKQLNPSRHLPAQS